MKFNQSIQIGSKTISNDAPVFLIAEAGVNHGGDMDVARQLIDIAAESGADAVKFQAFRTSSLIIEDVDKAPYQKQTTDQSESQASMLRKLELAKQQYVSLKQYCEAKGLIFLITPFDEPSLRELEEIGVEAYKVASTDTTNLPFLISIAKTGKPILFSTGMSYLNEVELALKEMTAFNQDIVLLQCTANYPISDDEANLRVIETYKAQFGALVGYSDHSVGIGAAPFAVPLGARVLEKHFTLDKGLKGPDHLASLNPDELKDFVKRVRQVEQYLGTTEKKPTASEMLTRSSLQKCLVTTTEVNPGDTWKESMFTAKRTGGKGISPIRFRELLGTPANRHYKPNEIIDE